MKQYSRYLLFLAAIALATTVPAWADSLYGEIILNPGFELMTKSGFTGGAHSFVDRFKRDGEGNVCVGYGDDTPDYILKVEGELNPITLEVESGGNDTTLVIQDRDRNILYCGDDNEQTNSPDAYLYRENIAPGTYHIWIGSFDPNQRWSYNLVVRED
ncbi:MAG: hypothetical protein SAJ12_15290 [Jaaginema sp. PMC 1079.18]|nr:hypothetical protein [Jaaginema sp. PMC 1080.18]MEC4852347.1 hypothetical protein [Jaaginema sp. PMC 1079.18]MEC4865517.1 hypothetical protein [Jaaginema sp. PMC 1078.18]